MEQLKKLTFAEAVAALVLLSVILYYFWVTYMSFYYHVSTDIADFKQAMIGLGAGSMVFLLGSTASSRKKDDVISNQNNNNKTP